DGAAGQMAKGSVTDAEHVVYTDHCIPGRPAPRAEPPPTADLAPFGAPGAPRDLALAYAIAGDARALPLLETAAGTSPEDVEVLLYLAEIYRNTGQHDRAVPLYERAIRLDPAQLTGSVGLGAIFFQRGRYAEAIRLWNDALAKNSGLMLTGTNLAMAQWRAGDQQTAASTLRKLIDLSPAFQPAVDLL